MHKLTRSLSAVALAVLLSVGASAAANADHNGSSPGPHNWVCKWWPVFC